MERYSFQSFSFQSLVHDASTLGGPGAVLPAGFANISVGFFLPGVLIALGGHHDSLRDGFLEFGLVAAAPRQSSVALALMPHTT